MERVKDLRTLQNMASKGFISLHPDTKQFGYIEDYKSREFTYRGINYVCRFVDGCFFPFVFYK